MTIILANVGLAFAFGVFLAIYFFFYRLNLGNPWRWVGGIAGGLIVGTVMALIDFWIIWPPANTLFTIAGFAIMILIAAIALCGNPKPRQGNRS